jgi:LmbE family N-acetylglucosaminyl deacetylase
MKVRGKRRAVAAVMAHPDDVEHSMGGTAWLLRNAYCLHILCATGGERGIRGKSADEARQIRQKEQAAACKLFGAKLAFLGRMDGDLYADKGICDEVAGRLARLKPVAVFTHWPINEHPDHTAAYDLTIRAIRQAGIRDRTEVYLSENAIGTQTNQFCPDVYVNISRVIEAKKTLVRCHRSQNPDEGAVERVVSRNQFRGMLAGCEYAEGFKTLYPLTANGPRGRATLLLGAGATWAGVLKQSI